jgi:large subunit ribosomal protein L15
MSLVAQLPKIIAKSQKRVGRGYGMGKGGHTSGRGTKGYTSRVGSKVPLWFEGGQLPLVKRLPMNRGKSRMNVITPSAEISLTVLNNMKADVVTLETLKLEKIIDKRYAKAKVIGNGTINRKVTLQGIPATKSAQSAIEQAGGSVVA